MRLIRRPKLMCDETVSRSTQEAVGLKTDTCPCGARLNSRARTRAGADVESPLPHGRGSESWRRLAHSNLGRLTVPVCLLSLSACSVRESTFDIVDHRRPGVEERYHERFDEAFFDIDPDGNVDVVLQRRSPDEEHPSQMIIQVIHIRSFWRSIPGTTTAHSTQINATIRYHVLAGRLGATFEGTGSVFFYLDREGRTLTGSLDVGLLEPKRRLMTGGDLFDKAELRGRFRAAHNPRKVVQLINEMNRLFGAPGD